MGGLLPMGTIRRIERDDVGAWAALRGRLWPDAEVSDLLSEARAYAAGTSQTIALAWIACSDAAHEYLGFVEVCVRAFSDGCDSMPVPHVEGWYVEPVARGRGIGRALMRAAEEWARAEGFREIASDTEVHNEASLHAHQACGFEEVDRLIKFRKELA
jgi:aminoglycoside 6'-N-acetyltransferase I